MNNIKVGDKLEIHCYKHNGKLHRQWDEAVVLEIKDDYIVFGNNKTTVVDSDGRVWKTKEPAIMFFYKDRWFNIIGQLKDYGIYFYFINPLRNSYQFIYNSRKTSIFQYFLVKSCIIYQFSLAYYITFLHFSTLYYSTLQLQSCSIYVSINMRKGQPLKLQVTI